MSIFGKIMTSIFGNTAHAGPVPSGGPIVGASTPKAAPIAAVDVTVIMDKLTDESDEDLDWRKSIVDLMKLLKLDSSLAARKVSTAAQNGASVAP
jgi:hypothetical protein